MSDRHRELKVSCIMSTIKFYMDNYARLQSLNLRGLPKIDETPKITQSE